MPDLIGPNGTRIASDTLKADIARKAQADADRILTSREPTMLDMQKAGTSPLEQVRDQNIATYMSLIAKHGGMTVDVQKGSAVYVFPVKEETN